MVQVNLDEDKSIIDFVVGNGNGVKGLIDTGLIKQVPKIFIQPPNERIPPLPQSQNISEAIDLSDLDGPNHAQVVDAIVKAAQNVGFFQVVNHGIPLQFLDSLRASAYRFFNQPPEAKALYLSEVSPSPHVKYSSSFKPEKDFALEWRDYLAMHYTTDEDAHQYWPKECNEDALEYLNYSKNLARRLMEILLQNIGLTDDDDIKVDSLVYPRAVNMNFYPACPNPDLTIGIKGHSDISALTVLLQDGIGGLQVKLVEDLADQSVKKGEWIEISPVPGALVINVGDVLQIISNGQYKSAEHKVRTTQSQSRVTVPVFVTPQTSQKIGPLPHLVEKHGVRRYRDVVYGDYLKNFFLSPLAGKSQLDFAKVDAAAVET